MESGEICMQVSLCSFPPARGLMKHSLPNQLNAAIWVHKLCLELATQVPSAYHLPKSQSPRKKVSIEQKSQCLHKNVLLKDHLQACFSKECPQFRYVTCFPAHSQSDIRVKWIRKCDPKCIRNIDLILKGETWVGCIR